MKLLFSSHFVCANLFNFILTVCPKNWKMIGSKCIQLLTDYDSIETSMLGDEANQESLTYEGNTIFDSHFEVKNHFTREMKSRVF